MNDKRVTPVSPIASVDAVEPTSFRKTYFEQLHYWREMSEQYAQKRKAREAGMTYKEVLSAAKTAKERS